MNFVEYADRDMQAIGVANVLAGELENALFNHEAISIAVPGGTTPAPVFDALCAVDLDWTRVHVMPTDERWVPGDHARSNARLIRERLLTDHAAAARFMPLWRPVADPKDAVAEVCAALAPLLPLSIVVLGMGADMHTASLFPGMPGLMAALGPDAAPVVAAYPAGQDEARISLSAATINDALSKHLIITGTDKRDALEEALSLPPEVAPVQAVLGEINVHWAE